MGLWSGYVRLDHETGRSKSYYVTQAIQNFLEEREEYLLALAVLERNEPWERALRKLIHK